MLKKQNIETHNSVQFIGRKEYLDDLESLWRKATSSLIACRGRRRIGKSTLIREFARRTSSAYIEIEGLPPDKEMTNQRQLDHFAEALAAQIAFVNRELSQAALVEEYLPGREYTVMVIGNGPRRENRPAEEPRQNEPDVF